MRHCRFCAGLQPDQFGGMIVAPGKGELMRLRIAIWAGLGALVVAFWSLYFSSSHRHSAFAGHMGIVWTVLDVTCPVALFRQHPLSVYFVLLINAATYALAGAVVETLRRRFKQPHLIAN
jgi:hypothetical protein